MKSLKWRVLIGCFVSYMFDSMEIIVLTIAMPILMNSIKMSPSEAGLLVTATLIGIGASSVVLGSYSDNFGRRKSLLLSIIIFGGFTAAIAVTNAWWQILVLRFLAGLGLGGLWAIASTYVAETWPAAQRGRAVAFVLSSFPVGGGLAALIAAAVLPTYGWRALFLVCGGAVATAVVYVYFCVPESPAWEARSVRRDKATAQQSVSMREIFAPELLRRTLLGTMASTFALTAYWGAATWLPTYLVRERGLSVHSMAMFITLLSVGQFIGYHVFGYIADAIGKKRAIILSFVGTTITLPIYAVTTDHVTLFWLGPVYSFFIAFAGLFGSYFSELFPTRIRTTGAGFCFNTGRGISAFSPFLLGGIATAYGLSFGIALCAVFYCLAGVATMLLPDTEPTSKKIDASNGLMEVKS